MKFPHSPILFYNKSVFPMAMYGFCYCFLYPRTECIMKYGAERKFYHRAVSHYLAIWARSTRFFIKTFQIYANEVKLGNKIIRNFWFLEEFISFIFFQVEQQDIDLLLISPHVTFSAGNFFEHRSTWKWELCFTLISRSGQWTRRSV